MLKKVLHIILILVLPAWCSSQNSQILDSLSTQYIDSLKYTLSFSKSDSARMVITERIGFYYSRLNTDSSIIYLNKALNIARQNNYVQAIARTLASISGVKEFQGNHAEAFQSLHKGPALLGQCRFLFRL